MALKTNTNSLHITGNSYVSICKKNINYSFTSIRRGSMSDDLMISDQSLGHNNRPLNARQIEANHFCWLNFFEGELNRTVLGHSLGRSWREKLFSSMVKPLSDKCSFVFFTSFSFSSSSCSLLLILCISLSSCETVST